MASIGQCPQLRLSRVQVAGALRLRNPRLEHRVVYWDGVDWLEGGAVRGEAEQINRITDVTPALPGWGKGGRQERRKEAWGGMEGGVVEPSHRYRLFLLPGPPLLQPPQCYCHYCGPEADNRYVPWGEALSPAGSGGPWFGFPRWVCKCQL